MIINTLQPWGAWCESWRIHHCHHGKTGGLNSSSSQISIASSLLPSSLSHHPQHSLHKVSPSLCHPVKRQTHHILTITIVITTMTRCKRHSHQHHNNHHHHHHHDHRHKEHDCHHHHDQVQEAGGTRTRVFEQKFSLPNGVKAEKVIKSRWSE